MYGKPYVHCYGINGEYYEKDKIIKIPINKDLIIGIHNDCVVYLWGFPGPDCNIYEFSNYGITWAFNKKEIYDMPLEEFLKKR